MHRLAFVSLLLTPSTGLLSQEPSLEPTTLSQTIQAALDTVITVVRQGTNLVPPDTKGRIYLREGYFSTRGSGTQEVRIPRAVLDSLRRGKRLDGTCPVGVSGFCDRPITGHLLSAWEPHFVAGAVMIRIDDQSVRSDRAPFSRRPAFARDSASTSYADRTRTSVTSTRSFDIALRLEAGAWYVTEIRSH